MWTKSESMTYGNRRSDRFASSTALDSHLRQGTRARFRPSQRSWAEKASFRSSKGIPRISYRYMFIGLSVSLSVTTKSVSVGSHPRPWATIVCPYFLLVPTTCPVVVGDRSMSTPPPLPTPTPKPSSPSTTRPPSGAKNVRGSSNYYNPTTGLNVS